MSRLVPNVAYKVDIIDADGKPLVVPLPEMTEFNATLTAQKICKSRGWKFIGLIPQFSIQ
jgi:hypothetical protein